MNTAARFKAHSGKVLEGPCILQMVQASSRDTRHCIVKASAIYQDQRQSNMAVFEFVLVAGGCVRMDYPLILKGGELAVLQLEPKDAKVDCQWTYQILDESEGERLRNAVRRAIR